MDIGLPNSIFKNISCLVAILFCVAIQEGYGQSTGDLAVIGFNSDGNDEFALTTFVDISSGTTIYFTDRSWDGSTENFEGSEGAYSYTVPSGGFSAGSVITIDPTNKTASDGGSVSQLSGDFDLSNSGDELYLYIGSDFDSPTTFLFAITNDSSWDASELDNTGLTDGVTALSDLGGSINDNTEYEGTREGTVSKLKGEIQKAENNWTTTDDSGDQSISFNTSSFSLVDLPTISFSTSAVNLTESSGTVDLNVELVESNNASIDVEVVYISAASTTTNGDDFDRYSTQTLSFSDSDGNGTTQSVSIDLIDDEKFEKSERAVFKLQNISTGTIINPSKLTLTIKDNDAPDIVFNEINADPGDDANGDGTVGDSESDEFLEWVNNSDHDIDISGWEYQDSGTTRFTFPEGTVIPAGHAVVLFNNSGNVQPRGNFGGAYIFTGKTDLNDSSEQLSLLDEEGNTVVSTTYPNEASGESNVLSPEITGNSYVDHSSMTGADGSLSSPGTKVDGTAFGSKYAVGIRGKQGWRMISSPVQNATFNDFLGDLRMQGIPGSDDPNGEGTLFTWTESNGGDYIKPADMSNSLTPGQGYIVYVFKDDEYNTDDIQRGFPKIINSNNSENNSMVSVGVSATNADGENGIDGNEGWNLLGNPFGTALEVGEIVSELKTIDDDANADIYVWDHEAGNGNGAYKTLTDGDRLPPFKAFFIKLNNQVSDGTFTFDKENFKVNPGTKFYKNNEHESFAFDLQLHGEQYYDSYSLEFSEKGTVDLDRYDAYKLFSLNANSINLFSEHGNSRLQKNVLPLELESSLKIPLSFEANGRTELTFRWDQPKDIPSDWNITLIDTENNQEIDLRTAQEYKFTVLREGQNKTLEKQGLLNKQKRKNGIDGEPRFVIALDPSVSSGQNDLPSSVRLNPNYPNPFNPQTTIPYEITEEAEVKLTVWNMIGQKVATLVDGIVEAGTHEETWNATNMPSGIYIARFEVGNEVFTRKMTLIK